MKKLLFIVVCCLFLVGCNDNSEEKNNNSYTCIKVDTSPIKGTISVISEISIECNNNIISKASGEIVYSYYSYDDALAGEKQLLQKNIYNKCSVERGETDIGILTCYNELDISNTNKCDEYKSYITSNGYACEIVK
nr:MAG TPA: Prokaryotic membrane lipoprotein lipid attachment site [Caudoviricetes sp.]